MLTTAEEDRLEEALPLQHDVEYQGNTYQYDLTPYWAGNDAEGDDATDSIEYPTLVFDWDMQARQDAERQPIGDVAEVDADTGEATVLEHHVNRSMSDLMLAVAVSTDHDENNVPPTVRGRQIARTVWRYVHFHLDLSEEGPNGERPMVVDVIEQPRDERVESTYRVQFPIRLRHVELETFERESTGDVDYDVETN